MTNPTEASGNARVDKAASPPRRSVWDSPWYWLYLFATAGLIGLLLIGPKFAARQAQIESSGLKRQRAAMHVRGKHVPSDAATNNSPEKLPAIPPANDDESAETTEVRLQPLYVLLVILLVCGGAGVFWQHWRQHRAAVSSTPAKPTGPEA